MAKTWTEPDILTNGKCDYFINKSVPYQDRSQLRKKKKHSGNKVGQISKQFFYQKLVGSSKALWFLCNL